MNASHLIKDKTILITGGTGSFGQSFVYELLNKYSPKKVIVYSRDEWKQWQMKQRHEVFQSDRLRFFLGDVRDEARLRRAFYGVDIVVHAAALKQVPTAEYNPAEYVRTNVIGAMNVVEAAIDCRVKKILALSTDKAVSPINLYGATKLCLEKLFVGANLYSANQQCIFSVVRYGNVLGSRGSIISILQEKLKKKDKNIEITDKRMTRFWITLQQSCDLVISTLKQMQGGEIYIPKLPSMKIIDIIKALIGDHIPIKESGIRKGEKLHERLICKEEAKDVYSYGNTYCLLPSLSGLPLNDPHAWKLFSESYKVANDFEYISSHNDEWLSQENLYLLLKNKDFLSFDS